MQNAIATMPRIRIARAHDERRVARAILFKVDHPRAIDRYIDYFGAPLTSSESSLGDPLPTVGTAARRPVPITGRPGHGPRVQAGFSSRPIT